MSVATRITGTPIDRLDAYAKVTGAARYAYEYAAERIAYAFPIQSTIAKGRIVAIDTERAKALPGVVAVLTYENAPRVQPDADPTLVVLQNERVAYYAQYVGVVVAETLEVARQAAGLVRVEYEAEAYKVELRFDDPEQYAPERVNGGFATDSIVGDVDAALRAAPVTFEATYTTPFYHNNPMEMHATLASWTDDGITLWDANQGPHVIQGEIATAFGLEPQRVRVIAPYVGGGFGSKAFTHPHIVLAIMASQVTGRPVKIMVTRQGMFGNVGYRSHIIQRLRLGAERDGTLQAIAHDVVEQSSTVEEFAEQTATQTRLMYAAPNRRTTHRLVRLDLPTPSIMRAPGEAPGTYALESAIDELAITLGVDPVELRIKNDAAVHPENGKPFSTRNLVACLREGAQRFGWDGRDRALRERRDGRWFVGTGVAAATYPARRRPSQALARAERDGRFRVLIDASDIGTGALTVLTQIATDALGVPLERIEVGIGDSMYPRAPFAGGSQGTSSWGTAVFDACTKLREQLDREHGGVVPPGGLEVPGEATAADDKYERHGFGAQFAEVRIDVDTREIHVARMLGVFAVGRILNPKTGRSQLIGGMTMGIGMALFEGTVLDPNFGYFATHDFAEYHIPVNADVRNLEAIWLDEDDRLVNPMGAKGIGEIGITGAAAAIANAVHHATGVRVRDLPITLDKLLV